MTRKRRDINYRFRCPKTGKVMHRSPEHAEIAADRIAYRNWLAGEDVAVAVFACEACGHLHPGRNRRRPVRPGRKLLHRYLWLDAPDAHAPARAGNFV